MLVGVLLRVVQIIPCITVAGDGGETGEFPREVHWLFFYDCIAFR